MCSTEIRDDARFCPSCGAVQPTAEVAGTDGDPLMGKVVAKKFKIEKLLGVGGMGKVYKARQLSLDKAVVVKVLHDHFRDDPQLVQRFQREAKAASRLNHPNSIQIIDFGQDDGGIVFMAMEFLQGQDLFSLIKKEGPLPADRIARVMIQVCSALAEAHEQNVIHRDLKPENIMVEDRRGQKDFVKVLDFGIAKIQDPGEGQQALTQAGMVCGTPEYMSPEQARGLQLDPRSDIYALGVVMYQLALGELPFHADTPIGIVTKHILEKPVPPRQRAPQLNIPEELEAIILRAMEKEADKRYASAIELGEALERFVQSRGFANVPSTNSNPAHAPAHGATGPTNSNPQGVAQRAPEPARTAPTPQGAVMQKGGSVSTESQQAAPASSGVRVAAISFAVVAVLGIGGAVAVKALGGGASTVADAGVVARPVDAGAPAVVDAGIPVAVVVDAGAAPAVVDAGAPAVVDAGSAPPRADAGPKKEPDPRPKAGAGRAKAMALNKKAVEAFNAAEGACGPDLRKMFEAAAAADPTYPEPYRYISQCYLGSQKPELACQAMKLYVELKGSEVSAERGKSLIASACR